MIIGITGTNGAGKGTIVDYLVQKKGFTHYSVRESLIEEINRRGLVVDRSSMREVANDLRTKEKPSFWAEQMHAKAKEAGGNAVIESIRNSGEAAFLHEQGTILWAVDADREIRYQRIQARASETDRVTFEEFVAQEEREWHGALGKADMDILAVMKMADHIFHNDTTPEEMFLDVEEALKEAGM